MSVESTNDPVAALGWALELLGPASPAAFLLAPARFVLAERTPDSLALTLHGDQCFGAAFGPAPPTRGEWDACVVDSSTLGDDLGRLSLRDRWDFFVAEVVPIEGPALEEIDDDAAVRALLNADAPHSAVWPGNPEIVAWYGVRDDAGLASVVALVRWESGYHVVSSMATRADARGRGLGQHVMKGVLHAASRRHLAWLGLGVGHDNLVAQRLYERVGFLRRAAFSVYGSASHDEPAGHA